MTDPCPQCGAQFADATASCEEQFDKLLALDHSREARRLDALTSGPAALGVGRPAAPGGAGRAVKQSKTPSRADYADFSAAFRAAVSFSSRPHISSQSLSTSRSASR